jgi:hypothetical protein
MKITKITDPDISIHLVPWYVEDDMTRVEVGMELNDRMTNHGDDTCVLVATDKDMIKAMLIGYIEDDYLFCWQARKSKDMRQPRLIFHKLCEWGRTKGMKKMRLMSGDKRIRRMYRRKYGFTSIGGSLMEKHYG